MPAIPNVPALRLWELAGAEDDRLFSPYCWRTRMALAHKGLAVQTVPWRFTEKAAIAFSGQDRVPVLMDGARAVHDSWEIARYLDEAYPDRPALFEGPQARAVALVFRQWCELQLHGPILRAIIGDLFASLHEKDKAYFRASREKRFGRTLEEMAAASAAALPELRGALAPVRAALAAQPFVSGTAPAYPDYILFGAFQWARAVSPIHLLEPDDPVFAWRERMLDLFGGMARAARGYPV
jgi:glutathione S-transferase